MTTPQRRRPRMRLKGNTAYLNTAAFGTLAPGGEEFIQMVRQPDGKIILRPMPPDPTVIAVARLIRPPKANGMPRFGGAPLLAHIPAGEYEVIWDDVAEIATLRPVQEKATGGAE